ncbi:MAG: CDGSH iron-sulfur domain-containing protein [Planctomycetia bacterium]
MSNPTPSPAGGPPAGVTITVKPNGPFLVSGPVKVCDPTGAVVKEGASMALCRCGHAAAKPFCDGSHGRMGWKG